MRSGEWTWLEIAKIFLSTLTPLAVVYLTFVVQNTVRENEAVAQREQAVTRLAQDIYVRRVRAELLASGLRRHAAEPVQTSLETLIRRKASYDEAYVEWNRASQSTLLTIRRFLDAPVYTELESVVEFHLIGEGFAPLDACLTQAYDEALRDRDPLPVLRRCQHRQLLQFILDCGYAVTDELFNMADSKSELRSREVFVSGQIWQRCGVPETGGRFRGYYSPGG